MTPRRRIAVLVVVLTGLVLSVQSAQATIDPGTNMSPGSPFAFQDTAVGTSRTQTVTVTNPAGQPDEVFSGAPTLVGANPGEFGISNNGCTATVTATNTCTFDITFAPTATGSYSAAVQFSASPSIANYQVSGTATPGGSISVSPTTLPFGNVKVGSSSQSTVTVTNNGSDNVTLGTITTSNPRYAASGTCNNAVVNKNGGTCQFTVTFAPDATGAVAADLTIPYTGAPDISKIVTLSGTGVQAQIVFSPTTGLNFSTPVGDTSPSQALTIRNAGTTFTTIGGITLAGAGAAQFAIASTTCGATLSAGQSCIVNVTHSPTGPGISTATVHVADDAPSPGSTQDANLTGTATVPGIQTTPTSLTWSTPQQDGTLGTTQTVTVKNTGTAPLKVGTLAIAGTNPGSFIFATGGDACSGATVNPAATCTVKITFRPQLIGAKSAALQIPSNAGATANVALSGTSAAPPAVTGAQGSSGCTKATVRWTTPTPPQYVKVQIVRNRDHVPATPTDGTVLTHGTGVLNDTGLQIGSTYHYSLFTVTKAYDNASRLIYAKPTSIALGAGRVCTPMNGAKITDLTPLIDWVAFGGGTSYSVRLVNTAGTTILVRYTNASTTKYQVQSQWQYSGASRKLVKGQSYTAYVYVYSDQFPIGRWIGQSKWSQG